MPYDLSGKVRPRAVVHITNCTTFNRRPILRERIKDDKMAKINPVDASAVRAAYKLGLMDGEQRFQHRLNVVTQVNRHLLDEITRLDAVEPVDGIAISILMAQNIEKKLRKYNTADGHAKQLRQKLKQRVSHLGRIAVYLKGIDIVEDAERKE